MYLVNMDSRLFEIPLIFMPFYRLIRGILFHHCASLCLSVRLSMHPSVCASKTYSENLTFLKIVNYGEIYVSPTHLVIFVHCEQGNEKLH